MLKQDRNDVEELQRLKHSYDVLCKEMSKVIVGQKGVIHLILVSLLSRGHCLLIGVPGLAKTLMISTLSNILNLKFSRIQFTPDLMPSDITGTEIIEEDVSKGRREFKFIKGPVFANIVLADEINRTPPKTQSALLEAMQEHNVTAAGKTYTLQEPFFVLATQNPIEQEGTYPLPEAQLDRFMFNLWVDYPSKEEEIEIIKTTTSGFEASLEKLISGEDIINYQHLIRQIPVSESLVEYVVDLVNKTRPDNSNAPKFIKDWVSWGAGPRASQFLILGAKANAALLGKPAPDLDDVSTVIKSVLRHRLVINFNAEAEGIGTIDIINKLIS